MAVFMCNNWTPPVTTPPVEPTPTYLTFQSPSSFTLNVYDNTKHWNGTLYYSTDTTNWSVWNGTSALNSIDNKLYLRGTGNTRITDNNKNYRWVLTGTAIECIGNIENLLDWETVELGNHPTMTNYCFIHLFRDNLSLIKAPSLPAIVLSGNCYVYMFSGTSIVVAPSLLATVLENDCYSYMFYGCLLLTTVPLLPANIMVDRCYNAMLYGCTAFKVSATQTGSYQYAWRMPTSGTGTTASNWSWVMLKNTGGTFIDTPVINVTYYVENPPV